jgi:hypothetical protein
MSRASRNSSAGIRKRGTADHAFDQVKFLSFSKRNHAFRQLAHDLRLQPPEQDIAFLLDFTFTAARMARPSVQVSTALSPAR